MLKAAASPKGTKVDVFSPVLTPGQTVFTYPLPASGRLKILGIGNGAPGASGRIGASTVVRTGGGGGASGYYDDIEYTIAELTAQFPGITQIYVDFGNLGTPGPAVTTADTDGVSGTGSSTVVLRVNSAGGLPIMQFLTGGPGQKGQIGVAGSGGAVAVGFGGLASAGAASLATGLANVSGNVKSPKGGSGGGSGGGLTAGNLEAVGSSVAPATSNYISAFNTGGAVTNNVAGASDGKTSTPAFTPQYPIGGVGGSGGGSSNSTVPAGKGGDASGYGSGGGGGGAGTNGGASGAGGKASYGMVRFEALA